MQIKLKEKEIPEHLKRYFKPSRGCGACHICHVVEVCREIKRVLRPDGVFFLNYGDSYATSRNGRSAADSKAVGNDDRTFRDKPFSTADELPAKNLCMIPQRVAIALQEDGWIIRAAPQWIKRNPLPESVKDRPGNAHEYIFMLVKSSRYFWDGEAVRRGGKEWSGQAGTFSRTNGKMTELNIPGQSRVSHRDRDDRVRPGRSLRTSDFFFDSLDDYIAHLTYIRDNGGLLLDTEGLPSAFVVNPRGYKFAHYATWPPALVAPMILASTSARGVCPKCGSPWIRTTAPTAEYAVNFGSNNGADHDRYGQGYRKHSKAATADYVTTGWQPDCECIRKAAPNYGMQGSEILEIVEEVAKEFAPIPAIVLDPFVGSGTTGEVCRELGRRFIGLDLNPTYLQENALPRSEKGTSQKSLEQLPLFNPEPRRVKGFAA